MAYARDYDTVEGTRPSLVRWGAVFGGAVIGLGLLTLLSALWFALAFGSHISGIRTNLEWFVGISAIVSLFIAGYLSGWLSGTRGWGSGLMNGLTMWGLLLIATVGIGVPALLNVFNINSVVGSATVPGGASLRVFGVANAPLWATFWSMIVGLVAAAIGGALGGATPRAEGVYAPRVERDYDDREYADTRGGYVTRTETVTRDPNRQAS